MKTLFALGVIATGLLSGTGVANALSDTHNGFDGYLLDVVRTGDR